MQLTGRANYEAYEAYIGEDVTSSSENAEKLVDTRLGFDSAGWYWSTRNLNDKADNRAGLTDAEVVKAITASVNGGCNALGLRLHHFRKAKAVLCRDIDG